MAKRKKVSKVTQQYNRELKRIKQFINRAEKRGYIFPENIVPDRPKRITSKSVNRLININPDYLYRKASYVDTETGEVRRGEVGREIERSNSAKKAAETRKRKREAEKKFWSGEPSPSPKPDDNIGFGTDEDLNRIRFENFLDQLFVRLGTPIDAGYQTEFGQYRRRSAAVAQAAEQARKEILKLVDQQVATYGKSKFGAMLQESAIDISMYIDLLLYASQATHVNTAYSGLLQIILGAKPTEAQLKSVTNLEEYDDDWTIN